MLTTMLLGLPLLAVAGYFGFSFGANVKKKQEANDPLNQYFTIGYFEGHGVSVNRGNKEHKKVPGSDFTYQVVLWANGNDQRKYEIRCSRGPVDHLAKAQDWFILYVQPWIEKTINTKQLIEVASDSDFKVATVNYHRIEGN